LSPIAGKLQSVVADRDSRNEMRRFTPFTDMLAALEEELDRPDCPRSGTTGSFTRAYVEATFDQVEKLSSAISISTLPDPQGSLDQRYTLRHRLEHQDQTSCSPPKRQKVPSANDKLVASAEAPSRLYFLEDTSIHDTIG
jgi:hypothetical protein